jgi:hypothetical protein
MSNDGRTNMGGWMVRLQRAEEAVRERWPWLRVAVEYGELMVSSPHPTSVYGSVTLSQTRPLARIGSGPSPVGSLSEARVVARDIEAVCDALDLAMAHVADVREAVPIQVP